MSNKQPVVIVAIISGVVLIITLAFILTKNNNVPVSDPAVPTESSDNEMAQTESDSSLPLEQVEQWGFDCEVQTYAQRADAELAEEEARLEEQNERLQTDLQLLESEREIFSLNKESELADREFLRCTPANISVEYETLYAEKVSNMNLFLEIGAEWSCKKAEELDDVDENNVEASLMTLRSGLISSGWPVVGSYVYHTDPERNHSEFKELLSDEGVDWEPYHPTMLSCSG